MSNYLIAIGGTGAKVAESIIHLAAMGIMQKKDLHTIFVDQDKANGNIARTQHLLESYIACKKVGFTEGREIFNVEITKSNPSLWAPISEINSNLKEILGYNVTSGETQVYKDLYDVLFTDQEKNTSLDEGFRGRPSIGAAAFFRNVDLKEEEPWKTLIRKVDVDAGSGQKVNIIIAGSIFGGTGASGLPTIARLVKQKLIEKGLNKQHLKICGILVLPYFKFMPSAEILEEQELFAKAENFLIKTKVALQYYRQNNYLTIFDKLYLLGDNNPDNLLNFSVGAKEQKNDAHIIELLAGLAAVDFLRAPDGDNIHSSKTVKVLARESDNTFEWEDVPDSKNVKERMSNFLRFALVFLFQYHEILMNSGQIKAHNVPWLRTYFSGKLSESQMQLANSVKTYLDLFTSWLIQINHFSNHEMKLINYKMLSNVNGNQVTLDKAFVMKNFNNAAQGLDGYHKPSLNEIWHGISAAKGFEMEEYLSSLHKVTKIN